MASDPPTDCTVNGSRKFLSIGNAETFRPKINELQDPLRADLHGSNQADAEGITKRGHAPVLSLCRQLLAAGLDPDRAMEVFRGATLALRIRSIGTAARLTVKERPFGPVFEQWAPFSTPPDAANGQSP